jgi:adenylate cyclase
MSDRLPRKLAAILYADVAEYSRLTGDDEDATHKALSEFLNLISSVIQSHRGEVMHYAGDAVLAKFDAVVDAVSGAMEIQEQLGARNSDLPDERKLQFRIGVNSGDVIEDRGDIYGDGVNVAARLESLAQPGGICISDAVRIAVGNKLGLAYDDLGEQRVKNIAEAVRAYNVVLEEEVTEAAPLNLPSLELPDKPSIAVLPFTNMSNDPEQEFFSDGITEDIITALSKISSMLVIARNSTFVYKGKAVDVKQVGRDQGVRHVLEGGVRKAGSRVRITAQLIDASTGQHRWAERYDRDLEDIFAVQDEITQKIVSELDVHLRSGEQARLFSSGTDNLEAWECVRLGSDLLNSMMEDQISEAMRLLKRAIDLDPEYASAWAWLAGGHFHISEDYDSKYSEEERKQSLESTKDCARQALEFDPSSADAYAFLGLYHLTLSDHEAAIENINKSVQLAPNHAINIAISAAILNKCGQPKKAIERIRKAMRLSPVYPSWYLSILGQAYRLASMFDVAIETYTELISAETDYLDGHIALAEIFGATNQPDQAAVSAKEVLRLNPDFTINKYVDGLAYSDPAENLRFTDGLRKAGLPE